MVFIFIKSGQGPSDSLVEFSYLRQAGNKLQAAGLTEQAINQYIDYLQKAQVDSSTHSKVAFSIASLSEEAGKLEQALSWYYQVELIDSASKYTADANKRIVALLEKLKKFSAAKYSLKQTTSLNKGSAKQGGQVVANIEGRPIYLHQVNEEFDMLPDAYKKQFGENQEAKKNFVKKFVADELLLAKAHRLQYQKDPKIIKQLAQVEKQLLIAKIIEAQVQSKITADASDIKNYFDANKQRYVIKERAKVSLIKVKGKKKANEIKKQLKNKVNFAKLVKKYSLDEATKDQGGKAPQFVFKGEPFMGLVKDVTDEILNTKQGKWAGPFLSQGYYYIFSVDELFQRVEPSFKQVKSRVESDYKTLKAQDKYKQLMDDIVKTEDVKLFLDKVK
ncbi:MAG: peptidyl-prolyl cis-trans isomerase [Bacteriovoracaceae bacterium]|nr:peptidyl-prolyl cis-trans isomerase [Bacteriovoracaceae bacterium]